MRSNTLVILLLLLIYISSHTISLSQERTVEDIPDILRVLDRSGRLYTTLCEFQTDTVLPEGKAVAAIIGIVANLGQFRIEVRLSQSPLPREETTEWLEGLLGVPVSYAPLSAFP